MAATTIPTMAMTATAQSTCSVVTEPRSLRTRRRASTPRWSVSRSASSRFIVVFPFLDGFPFVGLGLSGVAEHPQEGWGDEQRHEDDAEQGAGDGHPLADSVGLGDLVVEHRR